MADEIISRADALARGLKRYFTGKPCKHGHLTRRFVNGGCEGCLHARSKAWKQANIELQRLYQAGYRAVHQERLNAQSRQWRKDNPEKQKAARRRWDAQNHSYKLVMVRSWREKNADRIKQYSYAYYWSNRERNRSRSRQWDIDCPDKRLALNAKRRAARSNATPPWADLAAIQALYSLATDMTLKSGVPHHVDHVIPLKNPLVCGLHTAGNLQILPASDNLAKSNFFDPDAHVHTLPDQTQLRCRTG